MRIVLEFESVCFPLILHRRGGEGEETYGVVQSRIIFPDWVLGWVGDLVKDGHQVEVFMSQETGVPPPKDLLVGQVILPVIRSLPPPDRAFFVSCRAIPFPSILSGVVANLMADHLDKGGELYRNLGIRYHNREDT